MITNKVIDILITILAWIVVPLQIITTFLLGILVTLTFGLLLYPLSIIWIVLFLGPLIGISFLWEKASFIRPFISILGIPFALIGDIYVSLMPSMGEIDSRVVKMLYCQTFPYTWSFHKIHTKHININSNDKLMRIFNRISKDKAIRQYILNKYS